MEYLIKVSAVVSIFYFCYKIFLQRDTFFETNRWFLLFGLITAFIIPYFVIPVYIEVPALNTQDFIFDEITTNQTTQKHVFNWMNILTSFYLIGITIFSIRFIIQAASLVNIIIRNKGDKKGVYTFIKTDSVVSPFSFFKWIVYNPNNYSQEELDLIISHEKVHARQYHSIDVILTQLCCIALWFNPFIWLYNKDLKQNLEFIADKNVQLNSNCKKSYQYTLLKTSIPTHQLALSNNFYNSLIKKRIVMLQKSKSKKINLIKYALVIPLLALFLMSFNTKTIFIEKDNPLPVTKNHVINTESNAQLNVLEKQDDNTLKHEKINNNILNSKAKTHKKEEPTKSSLNTLKDVYEYLITKNSTDANIEKLISEAQTKGVTIKIKSIKRNSNSEITSIKIEANGKNSNASFNLNSDEAIEPIKISFEDNGKNLSIGNTRYKHRFHKVGKKGHVYVISDDDEQEIIHEIHGDSSNHFTFATSKGKHHVLGKNKKIEIIHTDEDTDLVEVIVEEDNDTDKEEDIIILKNSASSSTSSTGKSFKVKTIGKGNKDSKIIIKSDDNSEPLFIVDGKEHKKSNIDDLNPDDIESINVLKGESAEKKYGDKGKNGVVEITTKKK